MCGRYYINDGMTDEIKKMVHDVDRQFQSESVMEKPSFRNGILYHRLLIPASGFYEWNALKEKNTFTRQDAPSMFMAGFFDLREQ